MTGDRGITSINLFHTSSIHATASAKIAGFLIKLMFPRTPSILFQMVHADTDVHPGLVHSGSHLSVTSSEACVPSSCKPKHLPIGYSVIVTLTSFSI